MKGKLALCLLFVGVSSMLYAQVAPAPAPLKIGMPNPSWDAPVTPAATVLKADEVPACCAPPAAPPEVCTPPGSTVLKERRVFVPVRLREQRAVKVHREKTVERDGVALPRLRAVFTPKARLEVRSPGVCTPPQACGPVGCNSEVRLGVLGRHHKHKERQKIVER